MIVLDGTFELTPPPVKYLTVSVVLEGAIPYVLVNIKFDGEKAVVNLLCPDGNPNPTLNGFGTIVSSVSVDIPEPNWIYNVFSSKKRVANLRCTCFNFNK